MTDPKMTQLVNGKWPVWKNPNYEFPSKRQMLLCVIGHHDWFHGFYHNICNYCGGVKPMTDPKLVEKARELIREYCDGTFMKDERKWEIVGCPKAIIDEIVLALQSHGDEVRRKTVEECAKVAESKLLFISITDPYQYDGDISEAIRKLLEVKP